MFYEFGLSFRPVIFRYLPAVETQTICRCLHWPAFIMFPSIKFPPFFNTLRTCENASHPFQSRDVLIRASASEKTRLILLLRLLFLLVSHEENFIHGYTNNAVLIIFK